MDAHPGWPARPSNPGGAPPPGAVSPEARALLDDALRQVEPPQELAQVLLREPQPGELGWIVFRHGALYAQEQGWNHMIEAVTAEIAADFLRRNDRTWERCWIAEYRGLRLGSVMLVRRDERTAQLRLLYVEPQARGLGLGKRLVRECIAHAKALGYARMMLWTNDVLLPARGIYKAEGFRLTGEEPYDEFGKPGRSEVWELDW